MLLCVILLPLCFITTFDQPLLLDEYNRIQGCGVAAQRARGVVACGFHARPRRVCVSYRQSWQWQINLPQIDLCRNPDTERQRKRTQL